MAILTLNVPENISQSLLKLYPDERQRNENFFSVLAELKEQENKKQQLLNLLDELQATPMQRWRRFKR